MKKENASKWSVATGYKAARKGGALGPDRLEKGISNTFTKTDKDKKQPKRPRVAKRGEYRYEVLNTKGHVVKAFRTSQEAYSYMNKNQKSLSEGLGDLAHAAEKDHEVQMARSQLYKIAKYAIKLHEMMQAMDPDTDLESWIQAKITKSADYIGAVYHHLDYENAEQTAKMENRERVQKAFKAGGDEYKGTLAERLATKTNEADKECWDGYKKQGTKMKGDKQVNNCVPEMGEGSKKPDSVKFNPVAKNMNKFNKATVQTDRKKADKRGAIKHKGKIPESDEAQKKRDQ